MVYEFTELQGLMGYYYALENDQDELLALSFKEQYLPNGENSALPSTIFSSIVALSNKLDSLMALFSIGKIPTGTKDPFALRRAVNGIAKIVLTLEKNKTNLFLVAIFMSFLLIIVDAIDYWCAHSNLSLLLYYLTTAFGYTFRPFSICLIIAMIDSKIAKTHYLTTVPLLINGFLCFTSYFHRLVYFYNTDRVIQRGPLWFIPFITSIFSLVFLCTITFRKYQLSRKRESAFIITLYSLVSIALICESVHQLCALPSFST